MYCPHCQDVMECRALPATFFGLEAEQRWYRADHTDINWFRRGRQCLECGEGFLTAEVDEDYLDELVELRNALGEIKLNAERYLEESEAAAGSLERLSSSLGVLKALRLYKAYKA